MKNRVTNSKLLWLCLGFLSLLCAGCDGFLEEKSQASLSTPERYQDLRAIMNNEGQLNRNFSSLIETGSDDYFIKENVYKSRREAEKLVYSWIIDEQRSDRGSWDYPYNTIMLANIVLERIDKVKDGLATERQVLRGEAIFARAYALFFLSQIFCLPYDAENKATLLGLPLRTVSDYNVHFKRATMEETYDFIIAEFKACLALLPEEALFKSRPSKGAAHAALARLYLIMGRFEDANAEAKLALTYSDELMDFNDLEVDSPNPIPQLHKEMLFFGSSVSSSMLNLSRSFIPLHVYNLYAENDLRKRAFFVKSKAGDIQYKGNYTGHQYHFFAGLATDEIYLIRAECEIRNNRVEDGLTLLNQLLRLRYVKDSFTDYNGLDKEAALSLVLSERRKELIKRGARWMDLRRLLKENRTPTLFRVGDNGIDPLPYRLEPRANSYSYPIPFAVISIQPYKQNPL